MFLEKFPTLCEKCVGPVNKLPEGKGGKGGGGGIF